MCILMQFLFAPTFIGIFLSTLVTLEGRPSHVIPKLQQVFLNIYSFCLLNLERIQLSIFEAFNLLFCRSGFPQFLQIGNCGYLSNSSTSVLCHSNFRFGSLKAIINVDFMVLYFFLRGENIFASHIVESTIA